MSHTIEGTVEEQLRLEKLKTEEAISKIARDLQKAINRKDFTSTLYGQVLIELGYEQYVNTLKTYFSTELYTHQLKVRQFIELFSNNAEEIAYITMVTCINNALDKHTLIASSIQLIGKLKDIYMVNRLKSDNPKLHTYLGNEFRRASAKQKKKLIRKHINSLYTIDMRIVEDDSVKAMMIRAGTTLINLLELSGSNIIEVKDVVTRMRDGRTRHSKVVSLTEEAHHILTDVKLTSNIESVVNKLPMVVPPKDWTTPTDGGWLLGRNNLFTVSSKDVNKHLLKNGFEKGYSIINKLQKTAWRVNTRLLDLISTVYNNNMVDPLSPKTSPYLYGELPTSKVYKYYELIDKSLYPEWKDYRRDMEQCKIRLDAEHSKRIDITYTLSVAETMKKYTKLYFPYILDYRGRVYSDVNFLNPQGQHYVKALLEFAYGRYLNDSGVFWLKVHIANTFGKDKENYDNRIKWFDENEDDVLAVARDPIGNLKLWVYTDSPYEYVAACMAWLDHIEGRLVHAPIQLDATCSGIQMYSGLLRDEEGALSVNVIGDNRNDIYQIVADKVNMYLANNDFSQWAEYTDREGVTKVEYAGDVGKSMVGKITRKIVKHNVMTVPYSVTPRGMSNQLWNVMDEAKLKGTEFWKGEDWVANKILTELNQKAIYDTVKGARLGQEYLVALSKELDAPASWFSVLYRFPIKQASLKLKEKRVSTVYGSLQLSVEEPSLNSRRQANSIAPNFIHSIDSTILLYVIDKMESQIGVIHDCFLVHPNDGYNVQEKYKNGFITVMKANPLKDIQQQLDPNKVVPFPTLGKLDLKEVRNSKYIIS